MIERREARELLGMLAAKCQHFAAAPGGIPALTPEDMAHVLGMIRNDGVALYARVKYAGEADRVEELAFELFRKVSIDLGIGEWRIPRKDFIRDMCRLSLFETIDPQACPYCCGTGQLIVDSKLVKCQKCHDGRTWMREYDRAEILQCRPAAWSRYWSDRYDEVRDIAVLWDQMLEGALSKRLR